MIVKLAKLVALAGVVALSSSCGDFVRQGRSPVLLVITKLSAGSNDTGTLLSDVVVQRTSPTPCSTTSPCPTIFNDVATVEMTIQLKDQGSLGVLDEPSLTNSVTVNRYRVEYRRTDGRNNQGVDVPFAFDSAITVTVPAGTTVPASFQIVRHSAKEEAPLAALARSDDIISAIATVTFFGRDQAGNEITASANMGVEFGDFADQTN